MPAPAVKSSSPGDIAKALPRCPDHLSQVAKNEWRRIATPLHRAGVLTIFDRAALAAYCQAYARWVEAEMKLAETPPLIKAPSGYPIQSPWLSIANKQLELMNRYMGDLGLTPSARHRSQLGEKLKEQGDGQVQVIWRSIVFSGDEDADGKKSDDTASDRNQIIIDHDV